MKEGAIRTGIYPNYLAEVGVGDAEADEKVRAAERPVRDRDRLWDDPAFQTALSRRARADNELDREVTQL